ncbi:drug/metabolite transporter (DMT)-like permease [Clostridium tetanomorphum]|uniref:DMT family transporter n=1 Tax=Clostridium tetanomorphum TaxID=1553 RepID=A0A923E696_CLOTT|nr:DMT family transporter [Clostridium tetanomorphum]KAJ53718.1 transporter [Clostridium tetanomorphum DSM 665]MBC2397230.1 DMT family transporter [Clostridium tetanomorphum]MBP1862446.1 drug/metabolite transporter (DMT)-like permease [Clostridium tetanomorphum]NRS85714.1 drug/metabolite transporter (DMT)-like permease [Clostridium tetanomorphum]NRZ96276.1 drug/metabolite transporter (DMT)-like permease [Clostridium tetanomorphum]
MKNGVVYAILTSLVFSIMNALVKAVSLTVPSTEVAFFRSIIGTVIIYFIMKYNKVKFSTEGIPLLVVRGVLGALYLITYFYTISKIPLTDASILVHLSPFFVIIFSGIFLKEKISRKSFYLLPIVFLGALLLIKPFKYSYYSFEAIFGIISAMLSAAAGISIRLLTKKHHTYEIIFYFLATATLVSIPLMWNNFVVPTKQEFFYLIIIGIVSLIGQVFLTKAFTHENAIIVEVTRYIGIVFNAMWGFLFWREIPDMLTIIGGILIVSACIALSRQKGR